MSTTVSAKIPEDLKRELDESDVNISETIREALEAEVRQRRRQRLAERADAIRRSTGDGIETDEVVNLVREDRDDRAKREERNR
ncbi:hypothetical protein AArcSl_1884 [Halalkaliarchaeum desulfuricum]|uniref:Uncharacterized protein n=1 Tax=Halalkaliarchaeum desulfuricum TaxID=2055893 RepID=A0A343TK88_9EURY|nr:type II toxin-antitoxin system CcdA family antitoxin [Halalkaliarchaeum desulfuricum]AUX09510.1 hypothetical protein AArcSl_1884 [Halalkaliarchaeum desulfuricum]